jgi:hypothetical protein
MIQETFSIDSVNTHCAENIQRTLISVTKRRFTGRCKYHTLATWAILGALHICNAGTLRVKLKKKHNCKEYKELFCLGLLQVVRMVFVT